MLFFITSVSLPEIAEERGESSRVEIIARHKEVGHLGLENSFYYFICLVLDLIHDTPNLCTRSRIDGIKAVTWYFRGPINK